ncbi:MAG: acyltransferase [Candidatus Micrarchaeota archaeon]|nr:acyltransferase [Candidatus Micrarchaeota archaeon]
MPLMRRLSAHKFSGNSMHCWWRVKNPLATAVRFLLIYSARYLPSTSLKNVLYRICGARIGKGVTFGLGAVLDIFYPELVEVRDNTLIGYNSVILAHEFLQGQYRTGRVVIGKNVMIGANCTILPGVRIGDGASISAMSLVNRDIPAGQTWGGVPARRIK